MRAFLLSSKTPKKTSLEKFGYFPTDKPGVYRSNDNYNHLIDLLVLNELSDAPQNVFVKCFASRKKVRDSAFKAIDRYKLTSLYQSERLRWLVQGLWKFFNIFKGTDAMKNLPELTPEDASEMGNFWLPNMPIEDVLSKFKPEDVLSNYKPKDRLEGLKPKDRLEGLKPKDRLEGLKPKDRLEGLKPKDRLEWLSVEEIEAYLKRKKRQKK